MKSLHSLIFILVSAAALAQGIDPDVKAMLEAEKEFSALSKARGTAGAFSIFLTDDAITFGKDARVGKKHLDGQADDGSWLHWWPAVNDISSSGNFGFNSGPWERREKKSDENPVAFGQFLSIWKKTNGTWKVALDIGVAHAKPIARDTLSVPFPLLKNIPDLAPSPLQRVIAEEQKFVRDYVLKGNGTYKIYALDGARFLRNLSYPLGVQDLHTAAKAVGFKFTAGDISDSGDFAFVYGKAVVEVKEDKVVKSVDANYVRVWKKQDGKTWKIIADVLTWL